MDRSRLLSSSMSNVCHFLLFIILILFFTLWQFFLDFSILGESRGVHRQYLVIMMHIHGQSAPIEDGAIEIRGL